MQFTDIQKLLTNKWEDYDKKKKIITSEVLGFR